MKPNARLIVTNELGRSFGIHIVRKGDRFGLNKCLVHEDERGWGPMVEFYDLTYPDTFGEEGQFVSRYYTETLRKGEGGVGLNLCGYQPAWRVTAENMDQVLSFIGNE